MSDRILSFSQSWREFWFVYFS